MNVCREVYMCCATQVAWPCIIAEQAAMAQFMHLQLLSGVRTSVCVFDPSNQQVCHTAWLSYCNPWRWFISIHVWVWNVHVWAENLVFIWWCWDLLSIINILWNCKHASPTIRQCSAAKVHYVPRKSRPAHLGYIVQFRWEPGKEPENMLIMVCQQ